MEFEFLLLNLWRFLHLLYCDYFVIMFRQNYYFLCGKGEKIYIETFFNYINYDNKWEIYFKVI
jgi:hypothetical protein